MIKSPTFLTVNTLVTRGTYTHPTNALAISRTVWIFTLTRWDVTLLSLPARIALALSPKVYAVVVTQHRTHTYEVNETKYQTLK